MEYSHENILESNYVIFYFNEKKSDCKLISKFILEQEKLHKNLFFCQVDVTDLNLPILLCKENKKKNNKIYKFYYANTGLMREIIEDIES